MKSKLSTSCIFLLFTTSAALGFIYEVKSRVVSLPISAKHPTGKLYGKNVSLNKIKEPNLQILNINLSGRTIKLTDEQPIGRRPASDIDENLKNSLASSPIRDIEVSENRQSLPLVPSPAAVSQNLSRYGILNLKSDYYATKIQSIDKGTGGAAGPLSKSNYSVGIEYNHEFSHYFESIFYFNSRRLEMTSPISGTLLNNVVNLNSFGAGARYWFSKERKLGLGLLLGSEQLPFIKGISNTQVALDQLNTPQATLMATWNFKDLKPFTLGSEFFLTSYFPTNSDIYQSNSDLGFCGRIYVRQNVSTHLRFELGLDARFTNENTSIVTQQQVDYGMDLKLSLPIGGNFSP